MDEAALFRFLIFLIPIAIVLTWFQMSRRLRPVDRHMDRLITIVSCLLAISAGFAAVAWPQWAGWLAKISILATAVTLMSGLFWLRRKKRTDRELRKPDSKDVSETLAVKLASTQEELALATSKRKTLERNEAIREGKEILSGMGAQKACIYHLMEGRSDADYLEDLFKKAGWAVDTEETKSFKGIAKIPENRAILIKGSSADVLEKLGHALRLLMDVQVARRKSDSEAIHILLLRQIDESGSRW